MAVMEILVTGAGGFVGGALVRAGGAGPQGPGRHPAAPGLPAAGAATRFDLDDEEASLAPALDGVEVAYYLVHSMAEKGEFARRDLHRPGLRPGGQGPGSTGWCTCRAWATSAKSSAYLASRRAVEDALASTGPDLTVLRAAIVLGRGGPASRCWSSWSGGCR